MCAMRGGTEPLYEHVFGAMQSLLDPDVWATTKAMRDAAGAALE